MHRDDKGQIGGLEALIFGVLVMVLGTLALANAWGVIDAKSSALDAARAAARSLVQQDPGSDLPAVATTVADSTLRAEGRDPSRASVSVSGYLARCSRLTVRVRYREPLVAIPLLGSLGGGVDVSGTESELVDPYRNGLPGSATCDDTG